MSAFRSTRSCAGTPRVWSCCGMRVAAPIRGLRRARQWRLRRSAPDRRGMASRKSSFSRRAPIRRCRRSSAASHGATSRRASGGPKISRACRRSRRCSRMVRQVVYDSRRWRDVHAAIRALRPVLDDRDAPQLADVNWRRLTSMRYAIVHAARTMLTRAATIRSVDVRHRPGEGALAWLLVGWLAARLRWPEGPRLARIEEAAQRRRGARGDIRRCNRRDERQPDHRAIASGGAPFQVAARQESDADAVVAELNTLAGDRCLHDALTALAGASRSVDADRCPYCCRTRSIVRSCCTSARISSSAARSTLTFPALLFESTPGSTPLVPTA